MLDEIAELPAELQVKLLRVLQSGEIRPVGAVRPEQVDVRVIAATNKDLTTEVEAGRFREDLYYRLAVVTIRLPALRERVEDIPVLVQHFIERFNALHDRVGPRRLEGISTAALRALEFHDWPGNVRELENVIARAFALGVTGTLQEEHLSDAIRGALANRDEPTVSLPRPIGLDPLRRDLADTERRVIERALRASAGNVKAASRYAGDHT
jgi:DNA-binding NtrC family response regulator